MKLDNPFPLEVRLLYLYNYACWECGQNGSRSGGLELHHIWGRISASALNSAPLCKLCHVHILHTQEEHLRLFKKTINYLSKEKYKLLRIDEDFLEIIKNDLRVFKL